MGKGVCGAGALGAAVCFVSLLLGCSDTAEPRAQLVVVVDTNAAVVDQLALETGLSVDGALDSLRIEIVGGETEPRDLVLPNPLDWPPSFGIVSAQPVILRLRAFRAARALPFEGEPLPEATIERIAEIDPARDGIETVRVTLDAGCFGSRSRFTQPMETCLGEQQRGSPRDGLERGASASEAELATWSEAREKPCAAAPTVGRVCIPGGFTLLGSPELTALPVGALDAAPLKPVVVKPYFMDETEFTVGRFRAIANQLTTPMPDTPAPGVDREHCKWLGPDDPTNDAFPLNCIAYETALAACALSGGTLPTEARWEHAARGRGQARKYPWGDRAPACCAAAYLREGVPGPTSCDGAGPTPVGAFAASDCDVRDVSRDGVLDLAGNLSELVQDSAVSFSHDCWSASGILRDPVCVTGDVAARLVKGGNWGNGVFNLQGAVRLIAALPPPLIGFRCVYEDAP